MKFIQSVIKNKSQWLFGVGLFFVILVNLIFGSYHLGKKAAVDEPLWTFGRIQKFWNNIPDREWEKTMVSDKPGIAVALLSGIGMKIEDPLKQKSSFWNNKNANPEKPAKLEKVNNAFRSPILIFNALSLIVFYFLLKKLFSPLAAILAVSAIGFSPLILGISTIVNPDSVLWVFTSLSFLSFLIYLKNDKRKYVYWSGFFLGLAILTKYVANIFYLFFPLLIFLEISFNSQKYKDIEIFEILKKKIKDLAFLGIISGATVFLFLPALWKNPLKILEMTILSQAFEKIWIFFVGAIILWIIDIFIFKGKISSYLVKFLMLGKGYLPKILFGIILILISIVFVNVYSGMRFFDFESVLASPKTSHYFSGGLEMMLANFYSLIFGIGPIFLLFFLFALVKNIFKKENKQREVFYLMLFLFIYYLASFFNEVEATIRYQIMVIPVALIIASIGMAEFLKGFKNKPLFWLAIIFIFVFPIFSLYNIRPFYFSYASEFLPKTYSINPKDMGDGSYEAAQYLNSLPNAEKMVVWSDKDGVCSFFVGQCFNTRDPDDFESFNYFVVSSGRKTRTSRLIFQRIGNGKVYRYRIDKFYDMDNADWKLEIGGRTSNYLKVFSFDKLQK